MSNPGCYPSGFLALVAPLTDAGLLPADWPYTVNAVSGYSGGGNGMIERFQTEGNIAFRAYGLNLAHKHLPEMQKYAQLTYAPVFSPSVVNAHRGMMIDVPLNLAAMDDGISADTLHDRLTATYSDSPLITVAPLGSHPSELLLLDGVQSWEGMELIVASSDDGTQMRLIARLDNLAKGASGAAVQNLNLMSGLPETSGLRLARD